LSDPGALPDEPGGAVGKAALPGPEEIGARERDDAMGAYLMMFASLGLGLPLPFINIVASIVYYFLNRRSSRFVGFHALQALISHIPVTLLNTACLVWFVVELVGGSLITIPLLTTILFTAALNLAFIVYSLIALVRARRGLFFYIPPESVQILRKPKFNPIV
jgi:uncharacterized Tic20 family protein